VADSCAAQGYQVAQAQTQTQTQTQVVNEIASLASLTLTAGPSCSRCSHTRVTRSVVEHPDRLTRFGFAYLQALLEAQGRSIDVVHHTSSHDVAQIRGINVSLARSLAWNLTSADAAPRFRAVHHYHCAFAPVHAGRSPMRYHRDVYCALTARRFTGP
jgi:hypothetical protein